MKALCMILALAVAATGAAQAGPGSLNLGWNDCEGLPATLNRNFACNTNAGSQTLVGSFLAPSSVTAASAIEAVLDMVTTGATLRAWWQLASGLCRDGSLTASFDFTAGPFSCYDYWQGGASGGISMGSPIGNRAVIKVVAGLPPGSPLITSIPEGIEVYAFKAVIDNARTVGPDACSGCQAGAAICLSSIRIVQPDGTPGGNLIVTLPASRNWVTWQGGDGGPDPGCFVTPTRNPTWGSIKALYR